VRTQNGIIFPLSGRSLCCAPEINLARDLGCELTLRHAVIIPCDPDNKVFFPLIKDTIEKRNVAESPVEKAFWKEVTNSCYGKTAQGHREKRAFSLRTEKNDKIGPSKISNPFYAGYITSFVRAAVGEIMNRLPPDKMVFSVTTDGFITNATADEMEVAKLGPITQLYRQTVIDLTGRDEVLKEKHAVRQLLGWRTRGQATLKPGDESPDTEPFVLARAGVRPPIWATEVEEQNEWMLKTFFERTPETVIDIDVHTTMREMVLYGVDLVSKGLSRKAPMEYDFKRKPFAAKMASITLPGSGATYEHVALSTKPWADINEFKTVRAFWDDYRKKATVCLKTIDDFSEFAEYFEMMKSLPARVKRYLRSMDRFGLQRLRQNLCRAFKQGKAGFPKDSGMSARQFAELLTGIMSSYEVPTAVEDVENGKRSPFKPKTTPATPQVLRVLYELQGHFPSLNLDEVVAGAEENETSLADALTAACPFIARIDEPSVP
jgi:hypothetical protein